MKYYFIIQLINQDVKMTILYLIYYDQVKNIFIFFIEYIYKVNTSNIVIVHTLSKAPEPIQIQKLSLRR